MRGGRAETPGLAPVVTALRSLVRARLARTAVHFHEGLERGVGVEVGGEGGEDELEVGGRLLVEMSGLLEHAPDDLAEPDGVELGGGGVVWVGLGEGE